MTPGLVGLVLAAGSGSRLGGPKALVADRHGLTWVARAVQVSAQGGCAPTYVVVGAAVDEVRAALPADVKVAHAPDWEEGMGASLRTGLGAVEAGEPDSAAVVVMLVDTPGVTGEVVERLASQAIRHDPDVGQDLMASALGRATYGGRLGHPVLIGRDHWTEVAASARGDRGARDYLATHVVALVECGDIGSGDDIDTPEALDGWRGLPGG